MIFKCFNKAGVKPRGARPLGALSPALLSLAITSLAILSSPSFAQSSYQLARDVSASIAYPQGDIAKALPLWQKRAQKNDIRAMVALGHIHLKGFDVAQDYELARGWYQRAARQNDAEALFALGLIYDNGLGVKKNKDIAISLYQKAAAQNYAAAQNNLALALLSGKSQPHLYQRHKAQALNLYRLAALNGLAQARMNLGLNLRRMTLGDKQQKRALEWIKLAAYQGLAQAQDYLGYRAAYGIGQAKDMIEASFWYARAAQPNADKSADKKGSKSAQWWLGQLYLKGDISSGIRRSIPKAVAWMSLAANQNHPEALTRLALIYYQGQWVKPDPKKAHALLTKAAQAGFEPARTLLKKIKFKEKE